MENNSIDINFDNAPKVPCFATFPEGFLPSIIVQRCEPAPEKGIKHDGNWPPSAEFGVEYKCHDRQFPEVNHEAEVRYFDNVRDLETWLEQKRDWIAGTDYDFSMAYSVYKWDLGPEFMYHKEM